MPTILPLLSAVLFGVGAPDFTDHRAPHPISSLAASEGSREILPSEDVVFDFDQSALKPTAQAQLATIATWMKTHPGPRVVLEGHADSTGTAAYNRDLAARRAMLARNYLIGYGIAVDRILVVVFGEAGAQRDPNPNDRRVIAYATTESGREVAAAVLRDRPTLTAIWTERGTQYTMSGTQLAVASR